MDEMFLDIAKKRFSVRKFKLQLVEQEKLAIVLEAGRIAPSACNNQPWFFIVVKEKGNLEKLWGTYARDWFRQAPVVIVICGDHRQSWKRSDGKDHCDIDVAIAVDHMTLAAADIGLGTCWVCNFNRVVCSSILDLPPYIEPVALLPLGYPAEETLSDRPESKRKNTDAIVFYEKFDSSR
jgi:nitroreductase